MKLSSLKGKFLIGFIILIIFFGLLNLFSKQVRGIFYTISAPIQKPLWRVGDSISDFFEAIAKVKSLNQELSDLKFENQKLAVEIVELEELKKENESLRSALNIELTKDFKLSMGQIISKDISDDFVLINKGSNQGITKDMSVITEQRVLLGKVYEVYKNFSKVTLISNKSLSFDAKIPDKDTSGIIKGQGNLKLLLDLIPRDKEISRGDKVFSSNLGGVFPDNLLIGEVTEIKKNDIESLQQAEINPSFSIEEIDYLFIIID